MFDVGINYPFKLCMREQYGSFVGRGRRKVSRLHTIQWIIRSWRRQSSESITNIWLTAGYLTIIETRNLFLFLLVLRILSSTSSPICLRAAEPRSTNHSFRFICNCVLALIIYKKFDIFLWCSFSPESVCGFP